MLKFKMHGFLCQDSSDARPLQLDTLHVVLYAMSMQALDSNAVHLRVDNASRPTF